MEDTEKKREDTEKTARITAETQRARRKLFEKLFLAESYQWVHLSCAAGWDVAGEQRYCC
jgi:hypothetical protein